MIREAGLEPEITRTDEDTPLVRTAVHPLLRPIAVEWTRGAVTTPESAAPGGVAALLSSPDGAASGRSGIGPGRTSTARNSPSR